MKPAAKVAVYALWPVLKTPYRSTTTSLRGELTATEVRATILTTTMKRNCWLGHKRELSFGERQWCSTSHLTSELAPGRTVICP